MAWIKMRCDLFTDPKVVRISSALKADTLRTVGGLMSVWCLFDAHSVDGKMEGYTKETLDDHIRWAGFSVAMESVGWLAEIDGGLELPRFEEHNGQSAKRRAQDADRKKDARKTSAPEADKKRTREEKRREEKKESKTKEGAATATRLPADWTPSDDDEQFCNSERPELRVADVAAQFRDYWIGVAGAKGKKADWHATWRNWVRSQRSPQARASPAYQTPQEKQKSFADRLTGNSNDQHRPFIDLN